MTNSRSKASTSRLLAALVVACAVLGLGGVAQAGRKRVVVLAFEGPKADKFHDDVVRLIKKTHTVVATEKWNSAAEELGAAGASDKDLRKVAKKLKIDAIVEGKIEKRRDEFIIRLTLHTGRTGEPYGNPIGTKAEGPRIDGKAERDLKDELIGAIDNVAPNHGGEAVAEDDDDAEDRPVKKRAKPAEDDAEDKPAKRAEKAEEADDDKPVKRGFSRRMDDERGGDKVAGKPAKAAEDDDDKLPARKAAKPAEDDDKPARKLAKAEDDDDKLPARKAAKPAEDDDDDRPAKKARKADDDRPRKSRRKVAARDDDDQPGVDAEADDAPPLDARTALSPSQRAIDAVAGMSVTARRLSFTTRSGFMASPPGYKGNPVGGGMLEATFYPLALGHARRDRLKDIGLNVTYDRVLKIDSKQLTPDGKVQVFETKESRWGVAGVFRYALGRSAMAPVVGGTLGYGRQLFRISQAVDIPSVAYTIIEPGVLVRLPVFSKLTLGVEAKLMIITDTGQLQDQMHYGTTTLYGYEGAAGADYMITRNVFVRAAFRYEAIRFKFLGNGALTIARDGDPETADVKTGRDVYLGGYVSAGYAF